MGKKTAGKNSSDSSKSTIQSSLGYSDFAHNSLLFPGNSFTIEF